MNKLMLTTAALLLTSGACATDRPAADAPAAAPEPVPARQCLQHTGSRIKRDPAQPCLPAAGEVYTREDLDRTGAITTSDALRKLSPALH